MELSALHGCLGVMGASRVLWGWQCPQQEQHPHGPNHTCSSPALPAPLNTGSWETSRSHYPRTHPGAPTGCLMLTTWRRLWSTSHVWQRQGSTHGRCNTRGLCYWGSRAKQDGQSRKQANKQKTTQVAPESKSVPDRQGTSPRGGFTTTAQCYGPIAGGYLGAAGPGLGPSPSSGGADAEMCPAGSWHAWRHCCSAEPGPSMRCWKGDAGDSKCSCFPCSAVGPNWPWFVSNSSIPKFK